MNPVMVTYDLHKSSVHQDREPIRPLFATDFRISEHVAHRYVNKSGIDCGHMAPDRFIPSANSRCHGIVSWPQRWRTVGPANPKIRSPETMATDHNHRDNHQARYSQGQGKRHRDDRPAIQGGDHDNVSRRKGGKEPCRFPCRIHPTTA